MPPDNFDDDGATRHLARGLALPDVALASTAGGVVSPRRTSGTAVFFVYPWSGRPGQPNPPDWDDIHGAHGSTPEAEGFRDLYDRFAAMRAVVFGVSGQDTAYQREFAKRLSLPFALLSDESFALQRALSLPTFETGQVAYLKRLTLVSRDGVLRQCFHPIAAPASHAGDVLQWLGALRD